MTMTAAPARGTCSHDQLAHGEIRRGLTALLRRRLPAQDVEDVAQTVLCDALAAGRVPSDPEELRRWLSGIARHKIADFHRRAARRQARGAHEESALDVVPAAANTTPAAYEEREALEGVLGSVESRRDVETLEWLVREHGGERLADIASENRLPPPVVRQRVSRLRRALRSRWAGLVGAGTLVVLLAAAVAALEARPTVVAAIAREPVASQTPTATAVPAQVPADLRGAWSVQAVVPNRALSPVEARALELQTKRGTTVRVEAQTISLDLGLDPTPRRTWQVVGAAAGADGRIQLDVVGDEAKRDSAIVGFARDEYGARLDVMFRGASITLRRPVL